MSEWKTTAIAIGAEKRMFWREIFGREEIPLQSSGAVWCRIPGFDEAQLCYALDVAVLEPDQRARLVEVLAERLDIDAVLVDELLEDEGVPVRALGVCMVSSDFGAMLELMADADWYDPDVHGCEDDLDELEDLDMWAHYPGELLESHEVAEVGDDDGE